jgi:hypothetical protein
MDFDWNKAAIIRAKDLLDSNNLSKAEIYNKLIEFDFEPDQAKYAVDHMDDD